MHYKIRFRELNLKDTSQLYKIYSDKDAMKYRGSKSMEGVEDAKEFVQNRCETKGNILTIRKGVELLKDNKLIGSLMIRMDNNNSNECEIGYSIGRQFWKEGYGTEIVALLIYNIKKNKEIKYIIAWSHMENTASIKILERNGFCRVKNNTTEENYLYRKILK